MRKPLTALLAIAVAAPMGPALIPVAHGQAWADPARIYSPPPAREGGSYAGTTASYSGVGWMAPLRTKSTRAWCREQAEARKAAAERGSEATEKSEASVRVKTPRCR